MPIPGGVASIDAGFGFTCAVSRAGGTLCAGDGRYGVLGAGSTADSREFRPVVGGHAYRHVAAAPNFACALDAGGGAWCWGRNDFGQLGNASAGSESSVPVRAASGLTFRSLDAGGWHVCGIAVDGATWCWGRGGSGQLGGAPGRERNDTPVRVTGGHAFVAVSVGTYVSCALTAEGRAYCWGLNAGGALGTGDTSSRAGPQPVGPESP